jgi:hypothetical protein
MTGSQPSKALTSIGRVPLCMRSWAPTVPRRGTRCPARRRCWSRGTGLQLTTQHSSARSVVVHRATIWPPPATQCTDGINGVPAHRRATSFGCPFSSRRQRTSLQGREEPVALAGRSRSAHLAVHRCQWAAAEDTAVGGRERRRMASFGSDGHPTEKPDQLQSAATDFKVRLGYVGRCPCGVAAEEAHLPVRQATPSYFLQSSCVSR